MLRIKHKRQKGAHTRKKTETEPDLLHSTDREPGSVTEKTRRWKQERYTCCETRGWMDVFLSKHMTLTPGSTLAALDWSDTNKSTEMPRHLELNYTITLVPPSTFCTIDSNLSSAASVHFSCATAPAKLNWRTEALAVWFQSSTGVSIRILW